MIFKGSGDCTKIDWTFLGGSHRQLVVPVVLLFAVVALVLLLRLGRRRPRRSASYA